MNCQNCGAPMRLDEVKRYFECDYCTSIFIPEESADGVRVMGETRPVLCPVCKIELYLAYVDEFEVLYCDKCKGILFQQVSFLPMLQYLRTKFSKNPAAPLPFNPRELERQIYCPHCRRKMDTHPYGGPGNIVIDNCPHCRVNWLDYNELSRIVRSPDPRRWESDRNLPKHLEKLFRSKIEDDD